MAVSALTMTPYFAGYPFQGKYRIRQQLCLYTQRQSEDIPQDASRKRIQKSIVMIVLDRVSHSKNSHTHSNANEVV